VKSEFADIDAAMAKLLAFAVVNHIMAPMGILYGSQPNRAPTILRDLSILDHGLIFVFVRSDPLGSGPIKRIPKACEI